MILMYECSSSGLLGLLLSGRSEHSAPAAPRGPSGASAKLGDCTSIPYIGNSAKSPQFIHRNWKSNFLAQFIDIYKAEIFFPYFLQCHMRKVFTFLETHCGNCSPIPQGDTWKVLTFREKRTIKTSEYLRKIMMKSKLFCGVNLGPQALDLQLSICDNNRTSIIVLRLPL